MITTESENMELVHRFVDAINQQDWDAMGDLLAENVVIHGEGIRGIDALFNATGASTPRFQIKRSRPKTRSLRTIGSPFELQQPEPTVVSFGKSNHRARR